VEGRPAPAKQQPTSSLPNGTGSSLRRKCDIFMRRHLFQAPIHDKVLLKKTHHILIVKNRAHLGEKGRVSQLWKAPFQDV
jgi:hypothetical protein